ncbi:MAG: sugar transferase [Bacteroidetes bacterium]|nr:sugar transferase [Bacteroidota bacterium]
MYLISKRIFDFLAASILLILLLPLLLPIAILLRFTAEKEVFYFQKRMGKHRKEFSVWKFATMLKNSENMGTGTITLREDPRVTLIGSFLRISKINELPQLINIIKGDMSLVGPRPLIPRDFLRYPEDVQKEISYSKPGLTGIGSIIFRDEQDFVSRSEMDPHEFYQLYIIPYKGQVEVWYKEHASMTTDLLIIGLTAWSIFFPKNELVWKIFPSLPARPETLDSKTAPPVAI